MRRGRHPEASARPERAARVVRAVTLNGHSAPFDLIVMAGVDCPPTGGNDNQVQYDDDSLRHLHTLTSATPPDIRRFNACPSDVDRPRGRAHRGGDTSRHEV
jgi:hypothetical protein